MKDDHWPENIEDALDHLDTHLVGVSIDLMRDIMQRVIKLERQVDALRSTSGDWR